MKFDGWNNPCLVTDNRLAANCHPDLLVAVAMKFEYVLNLKTAKQRPSRSASRFRRMCWQGRTE